MTRVRALLIRLLNLYSGFGHDVSQVEMQKLAYFLQVAGEGMRVRFTKNQFGPHASKLKFALQRLEGHYIRGFGDLSGRSELVLMPDAEAEAEAEAEAYMTGDPDAALRFDQVAELIEGFETPYGMELLATVHWLARNQDPEAGRDPERAIALVQTWSDRKRLAFRAEHIRKAWRALAERGWIDGSTLIVGPSRR